MDLGQRRADLSRALSDWDQADSNLVRDAYRLPVAEALARVDLAEQKRAKLDEARAQYAEAFRGTNRSQAEALKAGGLNAEAIRGIQRQVIEDARVGLEILSAQAKRLSLSDRTRSEELQVSRTQLEGLRAAVDRHAAQLAADESPAGIERARTATLSDVMQMDIASGRTDPTDWKASYARLRDEIRRRGAAQPATDAGASDAGASGSQLLLPTLAGVWAYSNPDAQKKNGVYQWKAARLEILQRGDSVEGNYVCRLA
ncbi:MAG: hypothetical protein HY821_07655, partial [Acidobacteria bacterium]|nr:hypothetical protein [Acidobacteriota bacterium]